MVKLIIIIFAFISTFTFSQTIRGVVKNLENKKPLAFCSISVLNKAEGTITNIDGEFSLTTNKDSLLVAFYYLGYNEIELWLKKDISNNIYLKQQSYILQSVTVNAYTNKSITNIIIQLRNKVKSYKDEISEAKAITRTFTLKNSIIPIEINETDYSAELSLSSINNLYVKSGKIGFNNDAKTYYYSLDIATNYLKNIDFFNQKRNQNIITNKLLNSYYNKNNEDIFNLKVPLSYNFSQEIENNFKLSYNEIDEQFAVITFAHKDSINSGKIFFDKNKLEIKKIIVNKIKQKDLFYSLNSNTKINNTKLYIETNFKSYKEKQVIDFIYLKITSTLNYKNNNDCDTLETNFIANFYDYGKPFFKPFYGIERVFNDYEGVIITGNKTDLKHKDYISKTKKEEKFYNYIFKNAEQKKINPFKYISIEKIVDNIDIRWELLNNKSKNKFEINQFVYCDYYKANNNTYIFDSKAFIDYGSSYFTYKIDEQATIFIKGLLQISQTNSDELNKRFFNKYNNKYVPFFKIRKELAKTYKNIEYEKQKYIKSNIDKLTKCQIKSSQVQ